MNQGIRNRQSLRFSPFLALGLSLCLLWAQSMAASAQGARAGSAAGAHSTDAGPRDYIDPLKATHLAMTALAIGLGFSPLKAWAPLPISPPMSPKSG